MVKRIYLRMGKCNDWRYEVKIVILKIGKRFVNYRSSPFYYMHEPLCLTLRIIYIIYTICCAQWINIISFKSFYCSNYHYFRGWDCIGWTFYFDLEVTTCRLAKSYVLIYSLIWLSSASRISGIGLLLSNTCIQKTTPDKARYSKLLTH
jgi:hypothetical protein